MSGIIAWSPAWCAIKWRERVLLSRGPGWVDSVVETKLLFSFLWYVYELYALKS
jgi:hypothetical protein